VVSAWGELIATVSEALSTKPTLDHELMWRYMRQLVDRLFSALESDQVLDDSLDILVDVLGADRGLVLVTRSDGSALVVNARGHGKALLPEEREEMSRTVIREALETGRGIVWEPLMSLKASESVTMLGILSAMAVPLYAAATRRDQLW
jgi:GAF domain-containing protein